MLASLALVCYPPFLLFLVPLLLFSFCFVLCFLILLRFLPLPFPSVSLSFVCILLSSFPSLLSPLLPTAASLLSASPLLNSPPPPFRCYRSFFDRFSLTCLILSSFLLVLLLSILLFLFSLLFSTLRLLFLCLMLLGFFLFLSFPPPSYISSFPSPFLSCLFLRLAFSSSFGLFSLALILSLISVFSSFCHSLCIPSLPIRLNRPMCSCGLWFVFISLCFSPLPFVFLRGFFSLQPHLYSSAVAFCSAFPCSTPPPPFPLFSPLSPFHSSSPFLFALLSTFCSGLPSYSYPSLPLRVFAFAIALVLSLSFSCLSPALVTLLQGCLSGWIRLHLLFSFRQLRLHFL